MFSLYNPFTSYSTPTSPLFSLPLSRSPTSDLLAVAISPATGARRPRHRSSSPPPSPELVVVTPGVTVAPATITRTVAPAPSPAVRSFRSGFIGSTYGALNQEKGEQCGPVMPAHLHCWFTIWNRGGGRRHDSERVGLTGHDFGNRLCDVCRSVSLWCRFGWTRLKGLNVASALDAFSISVIKASFRPDRAEEALSGAGEELLWLLRRISGGFDIVKARAAREPREDDARSVGVPSVRRFWRASASSA
ncbi:hypothetical protein Taro_047878, partial [Colocasia esculenta]|nr:hypothetical protein [Colocasia esculenta]